jgi:hypothetical protein
VALELSLVNTPFILSAVLPAPSRRHHPEWLKCWSLAAAAVVVDPMSVVAAAAAALFPLRRMR